MKGIFCSECSKWNSHDSKYCSYCGHKLKKVSIYDKFYKKYCVNCGEKLDKDDNYCGICGYDVSKKIKKTDICAVCGEKIGNERYCYNCGHDTVKKTSFMKSYKEENLFKMIFSTSREGAIDYARTKKCPNCGVKFQPYFNYCEHCGTKLKRK